MKTILLAIETSGPGGAEKVVLSLANSLAVDGHRVMILLLKDGWLAEQLRAGKHEVLIVPLRRTFDLKWLRKVIDVVRLERVDVIHAHEFFMNSACTIVAAITGARCVATVHGKNYAADRWYRRMAYRLVGRSARLVAVSTGICDFLVQAVGVSASRVIVIRNGIDVSPFLRATERREAARAALCIEPTKWVIGCVGNLYPVKGHRYLITATAALRTRFKEVLVLIAGRGNLLESLQQQAHEAGVGDSIRFLGFREDAADLLAAIDAFAMPSLSEGLPLSLLEAMASAKAIVASSVGGIPEVITHMVTGLLVVPASPEDLVEGLAFLHDNRDAATIMGRRAQQEVIRNFGLNNMIRAYEALYEGK